MKTVSTTTFKEFLAACNNPGCPICRMAEKETRRYLGSLFYEYVNDTGVRKELRRSLGFCNLHTWQVVDQNLGNALGFAILYDDLTEHVANLLKQTNKSVVRASKLIPSQHCPACQVWEKTSQSQVELLLQQLEDPELFSALQLSEGLCLPHMTRVIALSKEAQDIEPLLSMHIEKLTSLRAELNEFIRKNDHRFMDEPAESESDSWVRALRSLAGLKKGSND
jgi:hypothetical protein